MNFIKNFDKTIAFIAFIFTMLFSFQGTAQTECYPDTHLLEIPQEFQSSHQYSESNPELTTLIKFHNARVIAITIDKEQKIVRALAHYIFPQDFLVTVTDGGGTADCVAACGGSWACLVACLLDRVEEEMGNM